MQEGRKFPQGENIFYDLPTINYEGGGGADWLNQLST
jgi:hypothetical protein